MGRLESADLGALKSDAQPSLDSAQRESVLGHYHTESFTRLAHPDCPSNSRRDQGAMLFTKRWTNRRRDASAHLDVGLASSSSAIHKRGPPPAFS
jgi:hypothetical protein